MQCKTRDPAFVLPVTALENFSHGIYSYILVGSGADLKIIETRGDASGKPATILRHRVFTSQAIHGISVETSHADAGCIILNAVAYGGRLLAWFQLVILLHVKPNGDSRCNLSKLLTIKLDDWILIGRVVLRNDDSVFATTATILTSHNRLLRSKVDWKVPCSIESVISDEVQAYLYSAEFVAIDNSQYIVASGTAFGEILTWTCTYDAEGDRWLTRPWKEFRGHSGSIFGLSISAQFIRNAKQRRLLVSSSDDRTIRVWDLSGIDAPFRARRSASSIGVDVGKNFLISTQDLCTTWAHESRVWDIEIVLETQLNPEHCLITSIGEDNQVLCWHTAICERNGEIESFSMRKIRGDRSHIGKNIWAYCQQGNDILSGGADGQIVRRSTDKYNLSARTFSQYFGTVASNLLRINPHIAAHTGTFEISGLKCYRLLDSFEGQFLTTTEQGALLRGDSSDTVENWRFLFRNIEDKPVTLTSDITGRTTFFAGGKTLQMLDLQSGLISSICDVSIPAVARLDLLWSKSRVNDGATEFCVSIIYRGKHDITLVWFTKNGTITGLTRTYLKLPDTFAVTSICYDQHAHSLICGSRAGALAIYTNVTSRRQSISDRSCLRHVHHSDTVTSIQCLRGSTIENNSHFGFYLTTGKDGYLCVVRVDRSTTDTTKSTIHLVHQIESSFSRHLEGAHLLLQSSSTTDIILFGFRADNFVVWNETKQRYMLELACGGAHREWDFKIRSSQDESVIGTVIWTKGKSVSYHSTILDNHPIVQTGGHGREIKALAAHKQSNESWLVATGSEDTTIRLFEYRFGEFRSISILAKHKAGLQDLRFSDDGQHLISAAGMEELFAWQLRSVPVIGLGLICTAALTPTNATADARLMAFDMVSINKSDADYTYSIIAAFSNGRLKQIYYTQCNDNASFTVLRELDMGSICLTQSHFLRSATTQQSQYPAQAMIAGTNGFITSFNLAETTDHGSIPLITGPRSKHKIHQNNITALSIRDLPHTMSDFSVQLIITGGDDNALAFTTSFLAPASAATSTSETPKYQTTLISRAHAAALTALAVQELSVQTGSVQSFAIVSAGNDQRVNLWLARAIDKGVFESPEIDVHFVDSQYTNVADIGQIAILDVEYGDMSCDMEIMLVGIGMETLNIFVPLAWPKIAIAS